MRKLSKKTLAVATTVVLLSGGGAAFAYWTTTGTGSGTAATGDAVGVTVFQTSTVSGLAPGSAAQELSGDFTNANTAAVKITQVNVAFSTTGWQPGCTSADYTLVQPTPQTGLVPTGVHVGAWLGGTILLKNGGSNQDGCKGQVVGLVYTTTTVAGA